MATSAAASPPPSLVVKGASSGRPWADRVVELRIEDHPEPIAELRRLLAVHRAYEHMNRGDLAVEAGDLGRALAEYGAAADLAPDNLEVVYWHAVTLATNGARRRLAAPLPARLRRRPELDRADPEADQARDHPGHARGTSPGGAHHPRGRPLRIEARPDLQRP